MIRPFYSEYVRHMLRFYTRNLSCYHFKSNVDLTNWNVCQEVLDQYSDLDKDILTYVYSSFDTLPDNVYKISIAHNINQNIVWDMMKDVERKIAIRRGLL